MLSVSTRATEEHVVPMYSSLSSEVMSTDPRCHNSLHRQNFDRSIY